MYKKYYQHFLKTNPEAQHYASHSHHFWPDVSRAAQLQYWDDSAKFVDDKWDYIFSTKVPAVQKLIAANLNLSKPGQIVFAPNTHEFVTRLLSCFSMQKKIKILTTDSEFYSFDRQINRFQEEGLIELVKVPAQPFTDFENRFKEKIKSQDWDLIFFSQVFFNSGVAIENLGEIVKSVTNVKTLIAVDGYHGFMALPTDLKPFEERIFYIAGSYKYAQGGEGCCFMYAPPNSELRPLNTGWFAGFSNLAKDGGQVVYSNDGYRFAGSTMDFSALYRLESVLNLFKDEKISVETIHAHVQKLQKNFIADIATAKINAWLDAKNILQKNLNYHGHFLTFEIGSNETTKKLHDEFKAKNIKTDYRGSRWRFGFGLYQNDHIDLAKLKN